jgi:glycosyltransferase involved in cell wall biosynthesis
VRLVFVTQVLDRRDAILGFVPRWVEGLARRCERVRVIALRAGDVSGLPGNVDLRVLGRRGRLRRWLRYRRFLAEALGRDGFDAVLAHMVPRYLLHAAGPARRAGAGLFLWYTHAGVDRRLRSAARLADAIFTASPESLRVDGARRVVTGHGIDLDHFGARGGGPATPHRLLAVGRLTPAKDPLTVLRATGILVRRGWDVRLDLVGGGLTDVDRQYADSIEAAIEREGLGERVERPGPVPYPEVPAWYDRASVLLHASRTGSVDKVVLEAMASERPVVSCNDSSPALFAELGAQAASLCFPAGDAQALAERVEALLRRSPDERAELGRRLRAIVARDHEVESLMERLVSEMRTRRGAARGGRA